MIYIGIDHGRSGAYAFISSSGVVVKPMAGGEFDECMREVVVYGEPAMVCVEQVGAMPGQGVTSMFNFGKSLGYIEGVLQALQIPYQ
jgi:crossover junction endodeoxyribonuclease RuvC